MAGTLSSPGQKLKFLSDQAFKDETALLLAEYGNKRGHVTAAPIPVDDTVELYLELALAFIDTRKEFGVDDVHGELWLTKSCSALTNGSIRVDIRRCLAGIVSRWPTKPATGGSTASYSRKSKPIDTPPRKGGSAQVHLPLRQYGAN
jgi:hypothetical protein